MSSTRPPSAEDLAQALAAQTAPDREEMKRFLPDGLVGVAGEFVNGPLWKAFKFALLSRQPEDPIVTDEPHVAAARAFKNNGYRRALEDLESLPFERPPTVAPVIPQTLTDEKD